MIANGQISKEALRSKIIETGMIQNELVKKAQEMLEQDEGIGAEELILYVDIEEAIYLHIF